MDSSDGIPYKMPYPLDTYTAKYRLELADVAVPVNLPSDPALNIYSNIGHLVACKLVYTNGRIFQFPALGMIISILYFFFHRAVAHKHRIFMFVLAADKTGNLDTFIIIGCRKRTLHRGLYRRRARSDCFAKVPSNVLAKNFFSQVNTMNRYLWLARSCHYITEDGRWQWIVWSKLVNLLHRFIIFFFILKFSIFFFMYITFLFCCWIVVVTEIVIPRIVDWR